MAFQRIISRASADGIIIKLYPFHISLEGMESVLLCRDADCQHSLIPPRPGLVLRMVSAAFPGSRGD